MNELNKLIEGIAFPLRYEGAYVVDATGDKVFCEGVGDSNEERQKNARLIAHALNNLNSENHAISRNSDNLQPKDGELQADADAKFYYEGSVSGRTGEGWVSGFIEQRREAIAWWNKLPEYEREECGKRWFPERRLQHITGREIQWIYEQYGNLVTLPMPKGGE